MSAASDLDTLFPEPREIDVTIWKDGRPVGKESVLVCFVLMSQTTKALKFIAPYISIIRNEMDRVRTDKGASLDLNSVVLQFGDEVVQLIAILTNRDYEFLQSLAPSDVLRILTACVEVNIDFFIRVLRPLLSEVTARLSSNSKVSETLIRGQEDSPS